MRFAVMPLVLLTTRIWMPDALVKNPRFCSPGGAHCVVVREYVNLPDHATARAKVVLEDEHPSQRRATLYAKKKRVLRTRIVAHYRNVLVSNGGRFAVVRRLEPPVVAETPVLDVFANGAMRTFTAGDVFAATDFDALDRFDFQVEARIEGEQLVVDRDVRFDLATATRIDALRDRHPSPRVWTLLTDDALAHLLDHPLPAYAPVAVKARIQGAVYVDVTISPEGTVTATRIVKPLPFGLDAAAAEAARRWTFKPRPSEWTAQIMFEYRFVTDEESRRVGCSLP